MKKTMLACLIATGCVFSVQANNPAGQEEGWFASAQEKCGQAYEFGKNKTTAAYGAVKNNPRKTVGVVAAAALAYAGYKWLTTKKEESHQVRLAVQTNRVLDVLYAAIMAHGNRLNVKLNEQLLDGVASEDKKLIEQYVRPLVVEYNKARTVSQRKDAKAKIIATICS